MTEQATRARLDAAIGEAGTEITTGEMIGLAGSLRGLAKDLRGGPDEADELLLGAADALEQAGLATRAKEGESWQPIETAPRDGRGVLLAKAPCDEWAGMFVAHWDASEEVWAFSSHHFVRRPTHWMPLPAPPAEARSA